MKKIFIYCLILLVGLTGCNDFLDTENLTKKDTSNFPKTEADITSLTAGVYSSISRISSVQTIFLAGDIASDNRFGGGGQNDRSMQSLTRLKRDNLDSFRNAWAHYYSAIFKVNTVLESLDKIQWTSKENRDFIEAEALFLRAHIYFDLCRLFGRVPLLTSTEKVNSPKAETNALYSQIATDLNSSINLLPSTRYSAKNNRNLGRVTKWAAEALMARVFLFYTGYYEQAALPLNDGGVFDKAKVIGLLEDCRTNSGHGLAPNFKELWAYSNPATATDYKYAAGLTWEGESGDNEETIFAYKYSILADYGHTYYGNPIILTSSLRNGGGQDYTKTFPFGAGWGAGPVNSQLWFDWIEKEPNDIRRQASILDVRDRNEIEGYSWGEDRMMEETGYWNKKYIATNAKRTSQDGKLEVVNYSCVLWGRTPDYKLDNTQDLVLIRFADVLLMLAELKKDAEPMNQVRNRVGLPPVAYSEDALRQERRFEFAFEGIRYYDLLRWHIAEEVLTRQNGVEIMNNSVKTKIDLSDLGKRLKETGGFFGIPQTQIDLSEGVLEQNPGWSSPDAIFTGQ